MRINVFGLGYVGCVSAACLANNNNQVYGIDIDPLKIDIINSGKSPIIEDGLDELIYKSVNKESLKAIYGEHIPEADISMICVGTPSNENGSLNLEYFIKVSEQIGRYLKSLNHYHLVVNRSTVLPGTIENILIPNLEKFSNKKIGVDFGVCMNPEFMREGSSITDYYNPPFTLIGAHDDKSGNLLEKIYTDVNAPIFKTSIKVAEMVKYVSNSFHAVKVTFANEVGAICRKLNIDSHEVMNLFVQDRKLNISDYYLKPGFAFGGSCLPKDLRAITYKAKELDLELPLLNSLMQSNKNQIDNVYNIINKTGKRKIGVLGLSFKSGTDDLRESPIVELIEKLIGKGFIVKIYDREVSMAKIFGSNKKYIESIIPHVSKLISSSIHEVIKTSDLILISKKEQDYLESLKENINSVYILDLVKLFNKNEEPKINYEGIGW